MTTPRREEPITLVSRLAWTEPAGLGTAPPVVELPHLGGVPIASESLAQGATSRHRAWPNRAGILESGEPTDTVHWYSALAIEPPEGVVVTHGSSTPPDLDDQLAWLHELIKGLSQIRGVVAPIRPEALCCIILTPGIDSVALAPSINRFPGAIDAVPTHLGEFPGGLQLVVTEEAWRHPEAYAGTVRAVLSGKG